MKYKECLVEIQAAVKDLFNDKEASELLDKIKNKLDQNKLASNIELTQDKIIKEIADGEKKIALIKKFNAYKDRQKAFDIFYGSLENFPNNPLRSLKALIGGVSSSERGARLSIDNHQIIFKSKYKGSFNGELEKNNLIDLAVSGKIDKEIFIEMFDNPFLRDEDGAVDVSITGNKEAYEIAKISKMMNDVVVDDKNSLGAYIKKLPGYVTRQSHVSHKMLKAAGDNVKDSDAHKAAWSDFIKTRLKPAETFEGADPNKFLSVAWNNIISGHHIVTLDGNQQFGSRNIANKQSAERVFHFKDGLSFYEYDQKFGNGNFFESMHLGLNKAGQDNGLMTVLGTNPINTLGNVITLLRNHYGGTIARDLNFKEIENVYKEVDGSINYGSDNWQAKTANAIGVMQETGKLGGITPTSFFGDLPNMITELNLNGMNLLDSSNVILKELLRTNSKEQLKDILQPFNLFSNSMISGLTEHDAIAEQLTGVLAKYKSSFYKYTGFTGLMQRFKSSMFLALENHYGNLAKKSSWNQLDDQIKSNLGLYKIDEGIWNIMRKTSLKEFEGYNLLTVDNIKEITTEDALDYLRKTKPDIKKFSNKQINDFKQEVQSKWRIFLNDRVHHGTLEPGARERSILNQGFERGTTAGLLMRLMTKFKSFPTTVYTRKLEPIIRGTGPNVRYDQAIPALAYYTVLTTVFGYLGLSVADMLMGKEPRDPRDPKTVAASIAKGGGGSIIYDLFYQEISRSNGGAASTLLGPAFADAEGLFKTLGNIYEGKFDKAGIKAFRLLEANLPEDIWFLRPAYNYLIGYQIKEMIDPGYFQRLEGYTKRATGQDFFLKP